MSTLHEHCQPSDASRDAFARSGTIAQCRKRTMKSSFISFGIYSASLAVLAGTAMNRLATAQDDISFARKTVAMTIGFAAGGGVDLYGRMLGRHLVSYLPGRPTLVVLNQPGAGGVSALN